MRHIVIGLLLLFVSCDKRLTNKLSGKYECQVYQKTFSLNNGSSDSTFYDIIDVKSKNHKIIVRNWEVYVDSLRNENLYKEGVYPVSYSLQFISDSMFYHAWSGGQGENGSNLWSCKKID